MSLRIARISGILAMFVAACGGTVRSRGDDGEGGVSNNGASANLGGSSSTSGQSSKAGSSSRAGSSALGGTNGTAGAIGMGGGVNCEAVDCPYPACSDGQMPITPAGLCCPICPPPLGCQKVECQPVMGCPSGYVLSQPAGACCQGCVPQPGGVACPKVACPHSVCPLGYVNGSLVGGCCTECVPDALFCNDDRDCVVADKPRSCCGCPEIISRRQYDAEVCWSDVDMPRMIPQSCYPQLVCDAVCGPCPAPPRVNCDTHRCWDPGLK